MATDQGTPPQQGTATVTVTVARNRFAPIFTQSLYVTSIVDTYAPGLTVLSVSATDADPPPVRPNMTETIYNMN